MHKIMAGVLLHIIFLFMNPNLKFYHNYLCGASKTRRGLMRYDKDIRKLFFGFLFCHKSGMNG